MSLQLGPGSPVLGRRPKRHLATVQIEDKVESESEESEPDLGAPHRYSYDDILYHIKHPFIIIYIIY